MKRVGIFGFFAVIMMAALIIGFTKYVAREQEEFEKLKLSYAVDYATDAATQAVLETGELGMDYGEKGKTKLDPNIAIENFVNVFLLNYDMNLSKENIEHVKANFMPIFIVASFDGYYMAQPRLIKSAQDYPENAATDQDWQLSFAPKMPYKYVSGGKAYALNFGDYTLKMDGNILSKEFTYPPGLSNREDIYREISKIISTDMSAAVDEFNKENPSWSNTVFIPAALTSISGTNAVRGPSIIALVQGVDLTTPKPISSFSIGGGKIMERRTVVGYIRNGIHYYTYSDKYSMIPGAPEILELFSSPKEAAMGNYSCDIKYFQ